MPTEEANVGLGSSKPVVEASSTPSTEMHTIEVEDRQIDCEVIVYHAENSEYPGARQRKSMSSLMNTSDSLWQQLELELDKAGAPEASPSRKVVKQRNMGHRVLRIARETWMELFFMVIVACCALVKPFLALLLLFFKAMLEAMVIMGSSLRCKPGFTVMPMLLFVANRVLAVCIPIVGMFYLGISAAMTSPSSALLSREEWVLVGLLALYDTATISRLPRIAEWFAIAWPRNADARTDMAALLELNANSSTNADDKAMETSGHEMIKRRLRTSPGTCFVVELAGQGVVNALYARPISCEAVQQRLSQGGRFSWRDGMLGAADAPAYGDDGLYVVGLQGSQGTSRAAMELALLYVMQHLVTNEQQAAYMAVRLPCFHQSEKSLHQYVMSQEDPMLAMFASGLYASRYSSVVKGLPSYWNDWESRNAAALVQFTNPVYGQDSFSRALFLIKLEWLIVHYGFCAVVAPGGGEALTGPCDGQQV